MTADGLWAAYVMNTDPMTLTTLTGPAARLDGHRPAARGLDRDVRRAERPGLRRQHGIDLALLEGVVAAGEDVDASASRRS